MSFIKPALFGAPSSRLIRIPDANYPSEASLPENGLNFNRGCAGVARGFCVFWKRRCEGVVRNYLKRVLGASALKNAEYSQTEENQRINELAGKQT